MPKIIRFYHRWQDLIQLVGFITMFGTLCGGIYMICNFISTANANTLAISDLQIWKSDTAVAMARMQQEVHDIHEWVKP